MRELLCDYLDGRLSRRRFLSRLVATGFTASAARSLVAAADLDQAVAGAPARYKVLTGSGGELLAEQVKAAGTRYVFTNPGSFEVGFFDALTDRPELQVIVGLHEGIVVSMADGYHRVTQQPAFVNVHAMGGTAQMAGQLFNAHRDGSALIITAGLQDATLFTDDLNMAPRPGFSQIEINRQFTKISWEVRNGASIPVAVRRAFKTASTAPGGPVYVAFSGAALDATQLSGDIWERERFMVNARPRPAADQLEQLARWLIEAERPLLLFGDEVWKSGAQASVVELAELTGAAAATGTLAAGTQAYFNFPSAHPQYVGAFGPARAYPNGSADLVAQIGIRDLGGIAVPAKPAIDPSARVVAVGIDSGQLGRTQPFDLAIVADVHATCTDLVAAVKSLATADRLNKIRRDRLGVVQPAVAKARAALLEAGRRNFESNPIHPDRLGWEIEQSADADAIVVTENLTGSNQFFKCGFRPDEKLFLGNTGFALGWGVGAAIGAKLGAPDRQVILSIGDGSVMYSASGFWTMARYHVPVLTVIWNNYDYQTVRQAFAGYRRRMSETGHYHGMYLGDPEIDFVKLAESQGVRGEKVVAPADLHAALARGIQATRDGNAYVLDVVIARVGAGADSKWHQTFNLAATRTRRA